MDLVSVGKYDILAEIKKLSDNKATKICIFGAGERGLKLYKELQGRYVDINFFCDNNIDKIGTSIGETKILSYKDLLELKDDTLIIISAANYNDIFSQLEEDDFPFVFLMHDIQKIYKNVPPMKWLDEFDHKVDYTDDNVVRLVNHFKKIIVDICDFYENT